MKDILSHGVLQRLHRDIAAFANNALQQEDMLRMSQILMQICPLRAA